MQREYETVYVLKPDLPAARLTRVQEKVNKIITENGGEIILEKDWGKRKLAYKIAKGQFGHYFFYNYKGTGAFINDLERTLKYEEDVIRFLTVKLDPRKAGSGKGKVNAIEEGKLKNEDLKVRDFEDRGHHHHHNRDRGGDHHHARDEAKEQPKQQEPVKAEGGENA